MIIYVDIDHTICYYNKESLNYSEALPDKERIEKINALYENGDKIIYWTARGTKTGIDWRATTEKQFEEWGVKYHELKFNKPVYDIFIDDKNINSDTFFDKEKK